MCMQYFIILFLADDTSCTQVNITLSRSVSISLRAVHRHSIMLMFLVFSNNQWKDMRYGSNRRTCDIYCFISVLIIVSCQRLKQIYVKGLGNIIMINIICSDVHVCLQLLTLTDIVSNRPNKDECCN